MASGEVVHIVLGHAVGVTDQTTVQSVLSIEDHIVPANGADVRQPRRIAALLQWVPVAEYGINLADLPVNARGEEQDQTARPAHLLLPVAALGMPTRPVVAVPC